MNNEKILNYLMMQIFESVKGAMDQYKRPREDMSLDFIFTELQNIENIAKMIIEKDGVE